MLELKDGMNFQNFNLDCKPEAYFKKKKSETVKEWLDRVSFKVSGWLEKAKFRQKNDYWISRSCNISLAVLSFLRENSMTKETLEELCGFEIDLKGSYNWTISELSKLELYTNLKFLV